MDRLDIISGWFAVLPWLLIGSGVASFFVSSLGFLFSSSVESRWMLWVYATCCIGLCLVQGRKYV
jgi:hypothetical protein